MGFKILIIEDDSQIRELYSIIIENSFDIEILEATGAKSAIEILEKDPDIKLIISDYHMPNGNGGKIYEYNLAHNNLPFILCSSNSAKELSAFANLQKDNPDNLDLGKYFDHNVLLEKITSIFERETKKSLKKSTDHNERYFRVRIDRYKHLPDLKCNVYIKTSANEYMKILSDENEMSEESLKGYTNMQVSNFYLDKNGFSQYIEKTIDYYIRQMTHNQSNLEQTIKYQKASVFDLQEAVHSLGISDFVIRFTDKVAESILSTLKNYNNLYHYIKNFVETDNYIKNHTMLMNYITAGLIHELPEIDNALIDDFIYASLFCDIGLKNKKLAMIQGIRDNNFQKLSPEEKTDVLTHPARSCEILQSERKDLKEVRTIIKVHHAAPDKNHNLKQALFILVHEFSYRILKEKKWKKKELLEILSQMKGNYSKDQFERPFHALSKIIKKDH